MEQKTEKDKFKKELYISKLLHNETGKKKPREA